MNRSLTVAAVAILAASTLPGALAIANADDTREMPIQVVTIEAKVRLVSTTDFRIACLTMDRDGEYTVPGLAGLVWQVKTSMITDDHGKVTGAYVEQ